MLAAGYTHPVAVPRADLGDGDGIEDENGEDGDVAVESRLYPHGEEFRQGIGGHFTFSVHVSGKNDER